MDSIGDVIYVIAIIGWIVYSFVSKSKKQKKGGSPAPSKREQTSSEPDIKKVLEQLLGKTEEEPEYSSPFDTNESKPTAIEVEYDTIGEKIESYEGEAMNPVGNYQFGKYKTDDIIPDQKPAVSPYEKFNSVNVTSKTEFVTEESDKTEMKVHEEENDSKYAKEFDIEKAVIFSEILKRPAWAN